jgi:hydroxylamine reductase (hybrid-cluster protein)
MNNKNCRYGICGVCCGQCSNGNGRVKIVAGEVKRLVDTVRYDWIISVVKSFKSKGVQERLRMVLLMHSFLYV